MNTLAQSSKHAAWRQWVVIATFALASVALIHHMILTILLLLPHNALTLPVMDYVQHRMHPFFAQRWSLFAPDPPLREQALTVQCRYGNGNDPIRSPWYDVDSPLMASRAANQFTPADRVLRVNRGAMAVVFGGTDDLRDRLYKELRQRASSNDGIERIRAEEILARLESDDRARFAENLELIAAIASAHCDRVYEGFDRDIVAVRARISIVEIPAFSRRHQEIGAGSHWEIVTEWAPYRRVASWDLAASTTRASMPALRAGRK